MSSIDNVIQNKINYQFDETSISLKEKYFKSQNNIKSLLNNNKFIFFFIILNSIFLIYSYIRIFNIYNKIEKNQISNLNGLYSSKDKILKNEKINDINISNNNVEELYLQYEEKMPHLQKINKKRTFVNRIPLPEKISCKPHFFTNEELIAFMSFLTNETIFFETGSGCSSIIANYYAKKSYSIEGCKTYYEKGIQNGLKDQLIFKDLKPDNPTWSYPGNKSNIEDWKNYFQSYKKEYNADVIFLDGRFKVATAMDIFNKINDNTIVLIHEYKFRTLYYILEDYYNYIYHWNTLYAFIKKKEIKEIPLEIQKQYWNIFL